jgi:DNA-binding protein H-NS
MSYIELVKFHERLKQAIAEKRASEAADAKEQLRAAAEKAGFSVEELFGKRGYRKGTVKYRNPKDTSQTWTGRGRKPNWLVDALKKGAKIDAFAV